jgi:phosphohistidine phosphatase
MELVVVRHAIAADRDAFAATGSDDALRPLTAEGARKMRRAARGLHEVVASVDAIVSSSLTRALETAEILRREYEMADVETADVLAPDNSVSDVVEWLATYDRKVVMLVGHEPQLGRLVTHLISGIDHPGLDLKKGSACLIEFDTNPAPGAGRLLWVLPPSVLRDLAG